MRKIILTFILVLASGFVLYCSYVCVKNINTIGSESEVKGKEMSSDEYIYKEDLLHLGYNLNDIEVIQNKISNVDVKEYFLKEKYDNISSYINALNFIPKNISRYVAYHNRNQNMTYDNTVLNVNMNLDYDFYTNVNTLHNYLDITTLVNKYNKLPDNYEIDDLVVLDNEYSNKGEKVRKVIYNDLKKMFDDAKKDNINLNVISGFRTYEKQDTLFNNSIKKNGIDHALIYSAKPGYSEHQLGLAIDINSVEENFKNTNEYKWLKNNSYKYGFIERYPENKEYITGFGYEPWHYRYLGVDITTRIFTENITYEEYVVKFLK
ncbi:MAG: M15 family metallopeptidase [Tenericutes bacterium]|nr:M15 family metallopeptidase [Mycoplasmatota bacterium]